jgi:hypothetical protein
MVGSVADGNIQEPAPKSDPEPRLNWKPVPDPTELTTEALQREISALKEIVMREITHVDNLSAEKFKGVQDKFDSIDDKFDDVAHRTAEQKVDTKNALDAALQAAKDAVALQTAASDKAIAKSETATTKQIDALAVLVDKSDERRGDEITDLKNRIVALETSRQSQGETKIDNRGSVQIAVMVVTVFVGLLGVLAAVAAIVVSVVK